MLARVDLGERATPGAIEHATELVQLMLDVARLQGGGQPWRRAGPAILVVDGDATQQLFDHSEIPVDDPDSTYSRGLFTESLDEHGPKVGEMLSRPIPPDLAGAIRMLGEAGQADDPWRQNRRQRTIDQRTVFALDDAAHDHLATFARYSRAKDLDDRIREDWPISAWHRGLVSAIDACLSWAHDVGPSLTSSIRQGLTYRFDVASDRLDELLAAVQDDHTRRTAARWLAGIDDAAAHLELLADLAKECALRAGRAQRVRNGIAHGTPPSAEATASVLDYARFRVFTALDYALEAVTSGRTMRELLDEQGNATYARTVALEAGISMRQQWAATS